MRNKLHNFIKTYLAFMQASLLTDFIKCNVHSIHKIPDVPHILPLKL